MREHTNNLMHRDPRSADACLAMADLWAYGNSVIHRITVARPSFRLKHILRRIQCNDAFAIPVPLAYYTFGGWKKSGFGDLNQHGPDSIRFYTKTKTVTARWPSTVHLTSGAARTMNFPTAS